MKTKKDMLVARICVSRETYYAVEEVSSRARSFLAEALAYGAGINDFVCHFIPTKTGYIWELGEIDTDIEFILYDDYISINFSGGGVLDGVTIHIDKKSMEYTTR